MSLIAAVGSTWVAGGAFSVFNDTGTATGAFTTGSARLDRGANALQVPGVCTPKYSDPTSPDATANMGSVNNTQCISTISVTNKGTLPMVLATAGSSVVDAISNLTGAAVPTAQNGLPCIVSAMVATDLGQVELPGVTFPLRLTTSVNPDNACQHLTDAITATLQVNESLPAAHL